MFQHFLAHRCCRRPTNVQNTNKHALAHAQTRTISRIGNRQLSSPLASFAPFAPFAPFTPSSATHSRFVHFGPRIHHPGTQKKSARLRQLLHSYNKLTYMMEAHSGHSAKIVEEAGFQCIWASGLSISAQLGVRDANEASSSEVVQVADYINQASTIPVLVDGDTGFGNFNNARRLVSRLEQLGISGVCIEDKVFPKTNSFIVKEQGPQSLAPVQEVVLKIAACKQVQRDPDFCVVARVEALICELSMEEALYRAEEYRKAGADAILIHSRRSSADEIREFLTKWKKRHPIIIVPTTYHHDIDEDEMRRLGVNIVIWANHNIRASTKAMQDVSNMIFKSRQVKQVEPLISSVREIFRLQKEHELADDEKKYLPKSTTADVTKSTAAGLHAVHLKQHHPKGLCPIEFVSYLRDLRVSFIVGVPDSLLDSFIQCLPAANQNQELIRRTTSSSSASSPALYHHIAANEGCALALAAGYQVGTQASLSQKPPIVYIQNSGLGNLINVLLSLTHRQVYAIPCVIMVGWRGDPSLYEKRDEPQHRVQGECMLEMLKAMSMDTFILPNDSDGHAQTVFSQAMARCIEIQQPVFVLVRAETFKPAPNLLSNSPPSTSQPAITSPPTFCRRDALRLIDDLTASSAWVATVCSTGKMSRELYEIGQHKLASASASASASAPATPAKYFLMVGSMGHALSFTAGLCYSGGMRGMVCCIDGDGSLLMHAGSLVTVNSLPRGTRLLHIALNNKLHESVGSQPTATMYPSVSLAGIAANMGYTHVKRVSTSEQAAQFIREFEQAGEAGRTSDSDTSPQCWFMEWVISPTPTESTKSLGRPKETPLERKTQFMSHLDTLRKLE